MTYTCNLGSKARVGYVLFGAAVIALAWWWDALRPTWPLVLGLWGFIVVLEGVAGF